MVLVHPDNPITHVESLVGYINVPEGDAKTTFGVLAFISATQ
jgi:hypothetical protein